MRSAWRVVAGFGLVSLAADMVYEGARSVHGPLLAALGASAAAVGLITGAGEAMALLLRLAAGSLADRSGRYWSLTFLGYALTAVCVPLLAIAPYAGSAGLALAVVLILAERAGKAVRSPAKSALLAAAAERVGVGRGFAVHKALDQIGAFAGPLLVAGILALTGTLSPALALLFVPGAVALALLLGLRRASPVVPFSSGVVSGRLSRHFYLFAASAGLATAGLVTFGLISFHASRDGLLSLAWIPVLYAAAMAAEAVAALVSGWLFDRWHGRVLLGLPVLGAFSAVFAFAGSTAMLVAGALLWGAAVGVQDSTVKALVADLVAAHRRATAYGVFAAVQGVAALAGGAAAGLLYEHSRLGLLILVGACQLAAAALLAVTLRKAVRVAG